LKGRKEEKEKEGGKKRGGEGRQGGMRIPLRQDKGKEGRGRERNKAGGLHSALDKDTRESDG